MIERHNGNIDESAWFWGIVEDINDPESLGRVRVRCFGIHTEVNRPGITEGIPTQELMWAMVGLPTTSASVSGVGETHGLAQGSQVIGIFRDGKSAQEPVVLFSIPGKPSSGPDVTVGFNDPDGEFPREDRVGESDINRLARGITADTWHEIEGEKLETDIGENSWNEPEIEYSATYPYNQVSEWRGGIVEEHDSTPEAIRWSRWHPAGTWEQWDSQGNRHTKVSGNDTLVVEGTGTVYAKGNITIITDGEVNLEAGTVNFRGTDLAQIEADLIKLGIDASEPVALGAKLLDYIANHVHNTSQGPSSKPVIPPKKNLLSEKVQVE